MDPAAVSNWADGLPATALCMRSVVHASHAATRHRRVCSLFLWPLGDHRFGSNQETCDRGSTLQSIAHHLRWIDDTLAREIPIFAGLRVVAKGIGRPVEDLADHDRAVLTCVDRNDTRRPGQCLAHDIDANFLIVVVGFDLIERFSRPQKGHASARHYPLFYGRPSGV